MTYSCTWQQQPTLVSLGPGSCLLIRSVRIGAIKSRGFRARETRTIQSCCLVFTLGARVGRDSVSHWDKLCNLVKDMSPTTNKDAHCLIGFSPAWSEIKIALVVEKQAVYIREFFFARTLVGAGISNSTNSRIRASGYRTYWNIFLYVSTLNNSAIKWTPGSFILTSEQATYTPIIAMTYRTLLLVQLKEKIRCW